MPRYNMAFEALYCRKIQITRPSHAAQVRRSASILFDYVAVSRSRLKPIQTSRQVRKDQWRLERAL